MPFFLQGGENFWAVEFFGWGWGATFEDPLRYVAYGAGENGGVLGGRGPIEHHLLSVEKRACGSKVDATLNPPREGIAKGLYFHPPQEPVVSRLPRLTAGSHARRTMRATRRLDPDIRGPVDSGRGYWPPLRFLHVIHRASVSRTALLDFRRGLRCARRA